jgi:hypothetical protein
MKYPLLILGLSDGAENELENWEIGIWTPDNEFLRSSLRYEGQAKTLD